MKLIVAGSRTFDDVSLLDHVVKNEINIFIEDIEEVISGHAIGADQLGERWAKIHKIPVKIFLPDWSAYGNSAGPIRNRLMADYGDFLLAFWDGESAGTKNMIRQMERLHKPHLIRYYA